MKLAQVAKPLCLILLLLIGFPFFFYGGPGYHSTRSFQAAWNLGHIFYFFLATSLLLLLLRTPQKTWPPFRLFLSLFTLVLIIGVGIEFLQKIIGGRSPDIMDVMRNQLGCILAFAFYAKFPHAKAADSTRRLFQGVALLCLFPSLWPFTQAFIDEQIARFQFPLLADFETPFERLRWTNPQQLSWETKLVRHGSRALRVQLSTAKYSGTALFHFPKDWQDFTTLHWSAYNMQQTPLTLYLRIHDTEHKQHGSTYADRYNKKFTLLPGWNDFVVDLKQVQHAPAERSMNMRHIESLGFFVVQQQHAQQIILDHVYLTP